MDTNVVQYLKDKYPEYLSVLDALLDLDLTVRQIDDILAVIRVFEEMV